MNSVPGAERRTLLLAAFAILLLVLALRAPWLSRLGLQGDEDISTLAFRGILSTGLPELPSGHVYTRAPLYSYLAAPLAAAGLDWLPRILSVLLSCVTAFLMIRLGIRWVGPSAAVLAGLLFAVSLLEIHTARQARFYALYQPLALLFLHALDRWMETGARPWGVLCAGACLAAMASHELGVTLAVLFLLPVLRGTYREVQVAGLGLLAVFGLLSVYQRRLIGFSMSGGLPTVAASSRPQSGGPLGEILTAAGPLGAGAGLVVVGCLALLLAWIGLWAARERSVLARLVGAAAFAIVAGAAGLHQVGAAMGGLLVLALVSPELLPGRRGRIGLLALTATVAVTAALWLATDVRTGLSLRHAVRDLGGGPLVIGLLLGWPPAIAFFASLGAAVVLVTSLRRRAAEGARFLVICVVILTVVRGLLARKIADRYLADVWPLWELLAGWTIVQGIRWGSAKFAPSPGVVFRWIAGGLAVAAILAAPGTAVTETVRYLARRPGEQVRGVTPIMVPDLRGAGRFLEEHAQPGDRIAATDWLSTYCYTGRVDLWLRSDGWKQQSVLVDGVPRDIYLGAAVVTRPEDLQAQVQEGPIWVVAGGLELFEENRRLDPRFQDFLRTHPAAWESSDGFTRILRLEPPVRRSGE